MNSMYPVYLITCTHPKYGNHIMPYVGVVLADGKSLQQRFAEHVKRGSKCNRLRNAIQKHGEEWFTIEQIDAGNTPEQALDLEQWWIKRLGTRSPNGYNLTNGGEGALGREVTEAMREAGRRTIGIARTFCDFRKGGLLGGKSAVISGQLAHARSMRTKESRVDVARAIGLRNASNGTLQKALHVRWHEKRGATNNGCPLCKVGA